MTLVQGLLKSLAITAPILMGTAAPAQQGPIVLLKLDDVTAASPRWRRTAEFLAQEGVKANFGVIGQALEKEDPALKEWVTALHKSGRIEFWNHGYATPFQKDEAKGIRGEFLGNSFENQLQALKRTQELGRLRFGITFAAFGPHSSGMDDNTFRALAEIPEIKAVFSPGMPRVATAGSVFMIQRRIELEKPIFNPNPDAVRERFEQIAKTVDYLSFQGHPNQWDDAKFANFQQAVRYLKEQGCRFMTVSEFLAQPNKK